MGTIYIGGSNNKKHGGSNWKICVFLFLFVVVIGSVLKLSAPMIVEEWINQKGAKGTGYAFSIRKVDLSLGKGQVILRDVKIFKAKTSTKMVESPNLTIQINWQDLLLSKNNKISVLADKIDLILSKDFSSEMKRIQTADINKNNDFYLESLEGKIGKLNIIEQKEDLSRTVIELNDVIFKVKDVSLLSVNKKTEFSFSSKIADGGKLSLTGKTSETNGNTPWSIQGSLKQVPADVFNKMEGNKLPFTFYEKSLNAAISAYSENGKVRGEITPDIKRLNLIEEKPGIPTQIIGRALNDKLTFTLPFTLKDELTLQYTETYRKLKTYRKSPTDNESPRPSEAKVSQAAKPKKPNSFWPF
ncbi:MAG TPA: hypothetical protein VNJ08_03210 [Bacteriovoracaceae bacterium]|nr:hypothetical protein [Bacteriovoracaceae bacterium]